MKKKELTNNIRSLRGFVIFIIIIIGFLFYSNGKNNQHIAKNYDNIMLNMHLIDNLGTDIRKNNKFIDYNAEKISKLSSKNSDIGDRIIGIYKEIYKEDIEAAKKILKKSNEFAYYGLIYAKEGYVIFEGENIGDEVLVKTKENVIIKR